MRPEKIYIDASAFYALIDRSDRHHEPAKALWPQLLEDRVTLFTSNCVVSETIDLLQGRIGFEAARLWYRDILCVVEVFWVDRQANQRAQDLWGLLGSKQVSFNDCVSSVIMNSNRIQSIFCFKPYFRLQGFRVLPAPVS